jgi:hypothetical protein
MPLSVIANSAADLKFLQYKRQIRFRNFKSKSGIEVIGPPVPITFRSS